MNQQGGNPPEEHRFGKGKQPPNPGRTPTKWLRELLAAQHDKSPAGRSNREAIALHLIEVATSWEVVIKGRGENAIPVASAKDSIAAAEVLYAYDMGKPVESLEVSNNDATKVLIYLPSNGRESEKPAQESPADGEAQGDA